MTTGVSGAVTSRQQIVGVAAVTVGVSGSVQINPRGRVDVVIGVSGAVTQVHQVSGRVDVTTGAIGSLAGGSAISGVVAVGTTVSGNVTVGRSVSGAVVVTTAASGAATIEIRQYQVSGRVDVQTGAGARSGRRSGSAARWLCGPMSPAGQPRRSSKGFRPSSRWFPSDPTFLCTARCPALVAESRGLSCDQ